MHRVVDVAPGGKVANFGFKVEGSGHDRHPYVERLSVYKGVAPC